MLTGMLDLRTVIAERCPQIIVKSVVSLGEGDFCTAYLVNDEWVFRLAKHGDAAASLRRESCLLPKIADRFEVSVPSRIAEDQRLGDLFRTCLD